MDIKYPHEDINPILPAVGDIKIFSKLKNIEKIPNAKIEIGKCIELLEHSAIYEIIGKNYAISIPFEIIEKYGLSSIDEAIKTILNEYIDYVKDENKNEYSSEKTTISDYYNRLKNLMLLSRQVLKEADKAKKILNNI